MGQVGPTCADQVVETCGDVQRSRDSLRCINVDDCDDTSICQGPALTDAQREVYASYPISMVNDLLPSGGAPARKRATIAVLRHGERLDGVDPFKWYRSREGSQCPFDPPLTNVGRRQALNAAGQLGSGHFCMVVSSPMLRCVETAVTICRELGLPLLLDAQLGEVFNKAHFGEGFGPSGPGLRPLEELNKLIPATVQRGADSGEEPPGPAWGETSAMARARMAARVDFYARRLQPSNTRGGYILVTHGDCVAATLAVALAAEQVGLMNKVVHSVGFCAYVLLERDAVEAQGGASLLDEEAGWRHKSSGITVTAADALGRDVNGTAGVDRDGMVATLRRHLAEEENQAYADAGSVV